MVAKAARVLGLTIGAAVLAVLSALPALGATTCTLTAGAVAPIGAPFTVSGAGFPGSTGVDVRVATAGASTDEFAVQTDASGAFQISLTPESVDTGEARVEASSGSCTASVRFLVGEPPLASDAPRATTGAAGDTPRTDTAGPVGERASWLPWLVALGLLMTGAVGLTVTRTRYVARDGELPPRR